MNRLLSKKREQSLSGQSTVEFALILPLIFLLFFAVFEFSALFIQEQKVAALSREIANAIYRDCGTLQGTERTDCITGLLAQLESGANAVLKDFTERGKLLASVYAPDLAGGGNPPPVMLAEQHSVGLGDYLSRFVAEDLDEQLVTDQGVVVIGEAYYDYNSFTPLENMLSFFNLPDSLYETTIY